MAFYGITDMALSSSLGWDDTMAAGSRRGTQNDMALMVI